MAPQVMDLSHPIKAQAHKLGFSLVGVTSPAQLPHAHVFEAWLEAGRNGEMAYLDTPRSRQCRAHPLRILPGCRSVLVLGARYPAPGSEAPAPNSVLTGKIASYAWGADYHEVLPGKMKTLVAFIEDQVGYPVPNRWYTDTGPLLERELAQRAGLGWIGKNTCLINPAHGSYFFLAEVLLGIELTPDEPFAYDRCGTCHRCIDACPTGCILPDRTLDARRCISYLTIELKGAIPLELRRQMDGWVFGCDVCQQVCPWNRFAGSTVDVAFLPTTTKPRPDLVEEMDLSATEFNRKFVHSPITRARRRGYLRNVAVALGSFRLPGAASTLENTLINEPEPLVRAHAVWALGQLGGTAALSALEMAAQKEADEGVKLEIQSAMHKN